jgi:hypothetical protein
MTSAKIAAASNARLLKAYESQLRLQRNFLEGARKQRFMFTPRGLYEGWRRLDAAAKVSVLTVAGLLTSVRTPQLPRIAQEPFGLTET